MSAQDLTFSELTTATAPFVEGPLADWWRADALGQFFATELDTLRPIVARAPAESSELGRLTTALAEEDAVHDSAVRFSVSTLETVEDDHPVAALRPLASEMLALVFPDRARLVNKSYEEEVGRLEARERARTPEVQAKLARFPVAHEEGGPADLEAFIATVLQPSTARLKASFEARAALATDATAPTAQALLNAKRSLIALVQSVLATYRTLDARLTPSDRVKVEALRELWSGAVRAATERANRRRAEAARNRAPADPA